MSERNLGLMMEIIRKDPESYEEEFREQFDHYLHTMKLLHLQPQQHRLELQPLLESVTFLSGLAKYYPKDSKEFSSNLISILSEQGAGLDPVVRMAFCKALVMLRNQNLMDAMELMNVFFELVKVEDKHLRKFILGAISAHLKRLYNVKKDAKLLSKIKAFVFAKMKDSRAIVARAAQLIAIDAFRKNYWREGNTANVIAQACFHKIPKIQVTAMKFFLGSKKDEDGDSDESDDEEEKQEDSKTLKEVMTAFRHGKKTRKRENDLEKAKKAISKKAKAKKEGRSRECNLYAIQCLFDPQEFVDKLFSSLEGKKVDKFEVRLFRVALCARIIGVHRLVTLGFYSYLHRYLYPKQRDVTRILLYAAQACHELVPPDTVEQLVRVIANNFVTDKNSPEAMTVGINAIREIFQNCPFAATEELLNDLAEYKTYKNKNVSMAARAIITLFRNINPKLLSRKNRGRHMQQDDEDLEFSGYARPIVADFISGAEVLEEEREETGEMEVDETMDSDIDVSDVDTDDVDTDGDDGPPLKKLRKDSKADDAEADSEDGWEDVDDEDGDEGEWETDDGEDEDEDVEGQEDGIEIDEDDEDDDADDEEEEDEEEEEQKDVEEKNTSPAVRTVSAKLSEKKKKLTKIDKAREKKETLRKASKISTDRILTQDEFRRIRQYQMKKQLVGEKRLKKQLGKGAKSDDLQLIEEMTEKLNQKNADGLPRLKDIEHFHKKKKQTKEERQAQCENNENDYRKVKKNGPHVGRNNRQLAKNKVFDMVKNKVRGKNRQRSFRDQQKSLKNYLMRQAGRKPGNE
ncbi:unnamed protein product [Auanema sp. JU1783]|nr:unnamed protein product [Auanema sp. JU1783]